MLETGRFDIFLSKECISPCVGEGRRGARSSLACRVPTRQKSGFLEFKDLAPLLHCFPSPTAIKEGLARVQAKSLSFGSREVFLCLSKYRNFVPLKGIFCPGKWHENTGLGLTLACSLPCPVRSREAVTSWRRRASAGVPCRRPDARCNPTQRGKFQALYLVQIHK